MPNIGTFDYVNPTTDSLHNTAGAAEAVNGSLLNHADFLVQQAVNQPGSEINQPSQLFQYNNNWIPESSYVSPWQYGDTFSVDNAYHAQNGGGAYDFNMPTSTYDANINDVIATEQPLGTVETVGFDDMEGPEQSYDIRSNEGLGGPYAGGGTSVVGMASELAPDGST